MIDWRRRSAEAAKEIEKGGNGFFGFRVGDLREEEGFRKQGWEIEKAER